MIKIFFIFIFIELKYNKPPHHHEIIENKTDIKSINYDDYLQYRDTDEKLVVLFANKYSKISDGFILDFYDFYKIYKNDKRFKILLVNLHKADHITDKIHFDIPKWILEYKKNHFIFRSSTNAHIVYTELDNFLTSKNILFLNNKNTLDSVIFKRRFFILFNKNMNNDIILEIKIKLKKQIDLYFYDENFVSEKYDFKIDKDEILVFSDLKEDKITKIKINNENMNNVYDIIAYNLHDKITEFHYNLHHLSMNHTFMMLLYDDKNIKSLENFKKTSSQFKNVVCVFNNIIKTPELLNVDLSVIHIPNILFINFIDGKNNNYLFNENNYKINQIEEKDFIRSYNMYINNNINLYIKSDKREPNYNDDFIKMTGIHIENFLKKSNDKLVLYYRTIDSTVKNIFENTMKEVIKYNKHKEDHDLLIAEMNIDFNDFSDFSKEDLNFLPCIILYSSYQRISSNNLCERSKINRDSIILNEEL